MASWAEHLRFRHLRILLSLHETCNLSETARRMSLTQPALSKWLRELEDEMGSLLFERLPKGLAPTDLCDLFASRARLMINEMDRTLELLDALSKGVQGKLSIGTTPSAMADVLPAAFAEMQRQYPKTSLVIREGHIDELLPALHDGKLNMIVSVLEDRDYGGDIAQVRLYQEHMVVVAGAQHPLQGKRKVTWEMALSYPWLAAPISSLVFRELQHELALANQPMPEFIGEVASTVLVSTILQRTEALSIFTSRSAGFLKATGNIMPLQLATQRTLFVGVLWRKGTALSVLERGFIEALQSASGLDPFQ